MNRRPGDNAKLEGASLWFRMRISIRIIQMGR